MVPDGLSVTWLCVSELGRTWMGTHHRKHVTLEAPRLGEVTTASAHHA